MPCRPVLDLLAESVAGIPARPAACNGLPDDPAIPAEQLELGRLAAGIKMTRANSSLELVSARAALERRFT